MNIKVKGLVSQGRGEGLILKIVCLLIRKTHILEWMAGNDVTSQVDAVIYVVLSKAEKHVPCGKLVGTTE
jgi:hypothetical protein